MTSRHLVKAGGHLKAQDEAHRKIAAELEAVIQGAAAQYRIEHAEPVTPAPTEGTPRA